MLSQWDDSFPASDQRKALTPFPGLGRAVQSVASSCGTSVLPAGLQLLKTQDTVSVTADSEW